MRFDGSDGTAMLAIGLSAAFAVVATGSMTLSSPSANVVVRSEVKVDRDVRVDRELVVREVRSAVMRRSGAATPVTTLHPVVYVDGVRVDTDVPGLPQDLDPREIQSIEVVRDGDEAGSVRISLKRVR